MPSLKIIFNLFYPPTEQLKKFIEQNNSNGGVYFPINGGSSLDDEWSAKFIQKDSTGDNISHLNSLLNEMTSIYWFWKNANLPDYVGFSHYRRTFEQSDFKDYHDYDIIVSKPIWSSDNISLAYQYKYYHVLSDLQTCIDVIRNEFDYEWGEGFRKYLLSSGTNLAPCNMFIMKRQLFEEWCCFVFPILLKLKKKICDTEEFQKRDNYQKRALCFLTERMFGYWYYRWKNTGLKTKELDMVEHLEYKPDGVNERGTYNKNIKILCTFHKKCEIDERISNSSIYLHIMGGKSLYSGNSQMLLNMIGDNTGNNISQFNRLFNEVTVLYWAWKNYNQIGNPDFIGLNSYRRFIKWDNAMLNENVIVAHWKSLKNEIDVYHQYRNAHVISDLDTFIRIFQQIYGNLDISKFFNRFFASDGFYDMNMFIMPKKCFFLYMDFMNKCISVCINIKESNLIDLTPRDEYQQRAYGFILERMTGLFIMYMKENQKYQVVNTDYYSVGCK